MQSNPLITIGILNYNAVERLRKIIPSILAQDYEPKEILVLDNGSRDDSVVFLKQFDKIKTIACPENLGYGHGKNILVDKAKGKYLFMLDNDIEIPQNDFLRRIFDEYKTIPDVAFLSPVICDIDKDYLDTGELAFNKINRNIPLDLILKTGIKKVPRYRGGACFFKKQIFVNLGGFDVIYPFSLDDYDISARAYLMGFANYRSTNLMAIHHGIDTRTKLESLCWKIQYQLCGFSRMIWKNYRWYNLLFWWPVSAAWIFYKSLRASVRYRSIRPVGAYIRSFAFFIRDFKDTLKQRKKIQAKRIVKKDLFLKTKHLESC